MSEKFNAKTLLVLRLLSTYSTLYGLDMVKLSGGALKRGLIYVTLARMEGADLICSKIGSDNRRVYRITDKGQKAIDEFDRQALGGEVRS